MAKVFTITEGLENMGALRTGGQGSVYKGKRTGAIITAVKLLPTPIHSEDHEDKHFRDFKNEVEKLKKVNENPSPNVVKILSSGLTESGALPFIEMEYIEGPELEELLKPPHQPVFSIRESLKLAQQLAAALAHCHRVGVKHGDIKSNNVKFNASTGNYVLLDFGLAVMSDEQRRTSLRNAGAVEFMAPEQHEGEMLFQSDVYSYGIILYELLAGTVPFPLINSHDTSRNMVMLAHIEKEIPDLLALREARLPESWSDDKRSHEMRVPPWLLQVIYKCLEKRPENRFANGTELYETICGYMEAADRNEDAAIMLDAYKEQNEKLLATVKRYERLNKAKWWIAAAAVILLVLSFLGVAALFDDRADLPQNGVLPDTSTQAQQLADTAAAPKSDTVRNTVVQPPPVNKKPKDPKKNRRTKDGLVDDVPYF
ncbi:serine/threonine protein kinase [Pedobacter faecalis]|uniref:serine/threonine protein kinase n=1 Tax=Pedobacter faecalis TaxID=3041495 RepID=UPI00254C662C|nr:serine/threonine-protein kinase [Pedobacter sp. ELA7]